MLNIMVTLQVFLGLRAFNQSTAEHDGGLINIGVIERGKMLLDDEDWVKNVKYEYDPEVYLEPMWDNDAASCGLIDPKEPNRLNKPVEELVNYYQGMILERLKLSHPNCNVRPSNT